MLAHVITHLYWLYLHDAHIRRLLLTFYWHRYPGMPAGYMHGYVRYLIFHYPAGMARCVNALFTHRPVLAARVCP